MKSQKEVILEELLNIFVTTKELDYFLSTPNKQFHGRAPADCLRNHDFSVFYDLLNRNVITSVFS
jgi:hypothetical protein